MPTVDQVPVAAVGGASNSMSVLGSRPSCVQTNDGNTSTVWVNQSSSAGRTELYTVDDCPSQAADPVNSCQGKMLAYCNGATKQFKIWKGDAFGSYFNVGSSSSYAWYTTDWYSLVKANLNSKNIGIYGADSQTGTWAFACTQIMRTIDYNVPADVFIPMFGWLLPLIGAALTVREVQTLLARVQGQWQRNPRTGRWSRFTYTDEEIGRMWREYQDGTYLRRRAFFDLGARLVRAADRGHHADGQLLVALA